MCACIEYHRKRRSKRVSRFSYLYSKRKKKKTNCFKCKLCIEYNSFWFEYGAEKQMHKIQNVRFFSFFFSWLCRMFLRGKMFGILWKYVEKAHFYFYCSLCLFVCLKWWIATLQNSCTDGVTRQCVNNNKKRKYS